jgi:probable addiction module antidote protein
MKKPNELQNFRDYLIGDLKKNPDEVAVYLEVSLEEFEKDDDIKALLLALRTVAEVQGGLGVLAEKTGLNRQNLYKIFGNKVTPKFSTLLLIIKGLGYTFTLKKVAAA